MDNIIVINKFFSFICSFLVFCRFAIGIQYKCPLGVKFSLHTKIHGSKCYEFVLHRHLTWEYAKSDCSSRRGRLVVIQNGRDQTFIMEGLKSNGFTGEGIWIGLSRQGNSNYRWTGSSSIYVNWANGQPSSSYGRRFLLDSPTQIYIPSIRSPRDCGMLKFTDSGRWYSLSCGKSYPYVCEYGAVRKDQITTKIMTTSTTKTTTRTTTHKPTTTPKLTTTPNPTTTEAEKEGGGECPSCINAKDITTCTRDTIVCPHGSQDCYVNTHHRSNYCRYRPIPFQGHPDVKCNYCCDISEHNCFRDILDQFVYAIDDI